MLAQRSKTQGRMRLKNAILAGFYGICTFSQKPAFPHFSCCIAKRFEIFSTFIDGDFWFVAFLVFVQFTKNANVDLDQKMNSSAATGCRIPAREVR
jgi:hypothetical protein